MPRPSPQTDRLRWIVALLARSPREQFTLAQIARHLNVSKATCIPTVAALTESGWLIRHPHCKTYQLGPALIEIGRAAEQASPIDALVPSLLELADNAKASCIVWRVTNDDLVLAEILDPSGPRHSWATMRRGHRLKPVAPLGAALVAWGDDERIDRWLASAGPVESDEIRTRLLAGLAAVRHWGFVVELQDHMQYEVFQLLQRLRARGPSDVEDLVDSVTKLAAQRLVGLEYVADTIDPESDYEVVSINSPVFDRYGDTELVVCLVDFPSRLSGADVVRLGGLVRDCACGFTDLLRGTRPVSWVTDP